MGSAGIRPGSSNSKMAGPSKRLGKKNRSLAKESCPPTTKDLTLVGRDICLHSGWPRRGGYCTMSQGITE